MSTYVAMTDPSLSGSIRLEKDITDKINISYILRTPISSFGKYSLRFNVGKDSQRFKILSMELRHFGSNYKCTDFIRASADASIRFVNKTNEFGGSAEMTFKVYKITSKDTLFPKNIYYFKGLTNWGSKPATEYNYLDDNSIQVMVQFGVSKSLPHCNCISQILSS